MLHQPNLTVTLPDPILKHAQPHVGMQQWRDEFNKRTYVESLFGNIKNEATENVGRGMHRHVGIMMHHLHLHSQQPISTADTGNGIKPRQR